MSYLENAKSVVNKVAANLTHIPVLKPAIDAIGNISEQEHSMDRIPILKIGVAYVENIRAIRDLVTLNPEDLETIVMANILCKERKLADVSASEGGADYFLKGLGPERIKILLRGVLESADVTSQVFKDALQDLDSRMMMGYELAKSGAKLGDGASSEADKAIWGHAKHLDKNSPKPVPELSSEAKINLTLSHFLARTFTAYFRDDPDPKVQEIIAEKDILLSAITDVMALKKAQGKPYRLIDDLWGKSRVEGGLGWTKKAREAVYQEVVDSRK